MLRKRPLVWLTGQLLGPVLCATEPDLRAPFCRRTAVPNRRSNAVGGIAPASSTEPPIFATRRPCRVPVRARPIIEAIRSIRCPLSHIARHIEQAKRIGLIRPHRRSGDSPIVIPSHNDRQIVSGTLVRHVSDLSRGGQEVSPPIDRLRPRAGGIFKLGLRRQPLARPAAIGRRVIPRDVNDGMIGSLRN